MKNSIMSSIEVSREFLRRENEVLLQQQRQQEPQETAPAGEVARVSEPYTLNMTPLMSRLNFAAGLLFRGIFNLPDDKVRRKTARKKYSPIDQYTQNALAERERTIYTSLPVVVPCDVVTSLGEVQTSTKIRTRPIGSRNESLSAYVIRTQNLPRTSRFQAAAAWFTREAHPDPMGTDPFVMTVFMLAFLARMTFDSLVYAIALMAMLYVAGVMFFLVINVSMPVLAREMSYAEDMVFSLIYDLFSSFTGLAVASYALYVSPFGVQSMWRALYDACVETPASHETIATLWVPCTSARILITLGILYAAAVFAPFRSVYPVCMATLSVLPALAFAMGVRGIEYMPFMITILYACVSCAFFGIFLTTPMRGTYVLNVVFAAAAYVFFISMCVGFHFF